MTYRQQVLGDCLRNASTVRALYELAEQAIAAERKLLRTAFHARPEALLNRSVRLLEQFGDFLRRLRQLAAGHAGEFRSTGFTQLFQTIRTELDERYLQTVDAVLEQLQFDQGIVASARLGDGNKGVQFVLRVPPGKGRDVPAYRALKRSNLSFAITGADELDWRALAQLRDSMLNDIANATAQSSDHIRDFFLALRDELGFYIGCLNLAETLSAIGMPICWPRPHASEEPALSARELYEPCLALLQKRAVVGNERRRPQLGHGHRPEPWRQVNLPAQYRRRASHDAIRDV